VSTTPKYQLQITLWDGAPHLTAGNKKNKEEEKEEG
jgi:hypothetical protein